MGILTSFLILTSSFMVTALKCFDCYSTTPARLCDCCILTYTTCDKKIDCNGSRVKKEITNAGFVYIFKYCSEEPDGCNWIDEDSEQVCDCKTNFCNGVTGG